LTAAADVEPRRRQFTALVLAGQRARGEPVADAAGLSHKCLVPVAGVPMLARVVAGLDASEAIGRIAVSIEDPGLLDTLPELSAMIASGRLLAIKSAGSPSLSALAAADSLGAGALPMLITTADHPLLTGAMVDDFLGVSARSGADMTAGLTPGAVLMAAYPRARRTFLKFRDGPYTGSNLFAVLTPDGLKALAFWRRVERDRKRPWRIAKAFGLRSLLAYLLGRLTLDETMVRASRTIGATVRAVPTPLAETGIDVDKPEDLILVEEILRAR
jgi:GTP:adenosylcobinamide-phosphate guanylyltransferase